LRISGGTELEARVKIRQPKELEAKELEVFDSLRLSVVVLVELAAEIAAEILAEIVVLAVQVVYGRVAAAVAAAAVG